MDRTERFYRIDRLLQARRAVPMAALIAELGVSRATIKRDLEYMKDRLSAPIVWDRSQRGYAFDHSLPGASRYSLPGLWFNAQEIFALLTMHRLRSNLGGGLLAPHIRPLLARLNALLGSRNQSAAEVQRRIRILHMVARAPRSEHFAAVASATLQRKRLRLRYHARSSDTQTDRVVSPQRLVHYRDNWYLDAWCHLRRDLRSFAVDAITSVEVLERPARPVAERRLDEVLAGGYGIFSGQRVTWARLRFSPEQARWVQAEQWHPRQVGRYAADGSYMLEIPYSQDTELIRDILKYGPDVEVVAPASLRARVHQRLAAALAAYC
jgi:predicted DNA-binding transcriptional regulator YafY